MCSDVDVLSVPRPWKDVLLSALVSLSQLKCAPYQRQTESLSIELNIHNSHTFDINLTQRQTTVAKKR
jgi:hypothetical protein